MQLTALVGPKRTEVFYSGTLEGAQRFITALYDYHRLQPA